MTWQRILTACVLSGLLGTTGAAYGQTEAQSLDELPEEVQEKLQPRNDAFIRLMMGDVSATVGDSDLDAELGLELPAGSFVRTGGDGRANIELPGGHRFTLDSNTEVRLRGYGSDEIFLELRSGTVFVRTQTVGLGGLDFIVKGTTTRLVVKQPNTLFQMNCQDGSEACEVNVLNGSVEVLNPNFPDATVALLGSRSAFKILAASPVSPNLVNAVEQALVNQMESFNDFLDRLPNIGGPAPPPDVPDDPKEPEKPAEPEPEYIFETMQPYERPELEPPFPVSAERQFLLPQDEGWAVNISAGPAVFETTAGARIVGLFAPELQIPIGPVHLTLWLPVFWNPAEPFLDPSRSWANISEYEWSERNGRPVALDIFSDILNKIKEVSWESEDGRSFIRFGRIDRFHFGHGMLLNEFQPAIVWPQRRNLSFEVGIAGPVLQWQIFASNLDPITLPAGLFGTRLGIRPGGDTDEKVLETMEIGVELILDPDPRNGDHTPILSEDGQTTLLSGWPTLFATAATFEIHPYYGNDNPLTIEAFLDIATSWWAGTVNGQAYPWIDFTETLPIHHNGNFGIMTGVKGQLLELLRYHLEYRFEHDGFQTGHWDASYEVIGGTALRLLPYMFPQPGVQSDGTCCVPSIHLISFGFDFGSPDVGGVSFRHTESINADRPYNIFNFKAYFKPTFIEILENFSVTLNYDRRNIRGFDDFWVNFTSPLTVFGIALDYAPAEGLVITGRFSRYFEQVGTELTARNVFAIITAVTL